MQAYRKQT